MPKFCRSTSICYSTSSPVKEYVYYLSPPPSFVPSSIIQCAKPLAVNCSPMFGGTIFLPSGFYYTLYSVSSGIVTEFY